jgi:hypothetical protein
MRKSLWIILAVLCVATSTPKAHADTLYTPVFTCDKPCSSLPTAPNVSFPSPTTITVTWHGLVFPIALLAPFKPTDSGGILWFASWPVIPPPNPGCHAAPSPSVCDASFLIRDFIALSNSSYVLHNLPPPGPLSTVFQDSGTLSFTFVPEPSSVALMLAGIGFLLVLMRKRLALGHQQAS